MTIDGIGEVLAAANNKDLAEKGGSHNQKGIEFQRNWALIRIFQLDEVDESDFVVLFETVQDVAILDSETAPTRIVIHQVKKMDRKEWTWNALTKLKEPAPSGTGKALKKVNAGATVLGSPLGKLCAAVRAFKLLDSSGRFISNAGCDIEMADGTNAATSLPVALSGLPAHFAEVLSEGLAALQSPGEVAPDLSRIFLERVDVPPDDAATYTVGVAHKFLENRSPRHAGQARSLVDALLARIGPLGAKTDACATFDEVRAERGFSRAEFRSALGALQEIPDLLDLLDMLITKLQNEGMPFMDLVGLKAAATSIYRYQVMGSHSAELDTIIASCDGFLADKSASLNAAMLPVMTDGFAVLTAAFPSQSPATLRAHLALRMVSSCVDLT